MNKKICILIMSTCWNWSCNNNPDTERFQHKRDNIIHVKDKMKEIDFDEVLISQFANLYTINEYLLISDSRSPDKLIHIFDIKNYNYITSIVNRGQGKGEITTIGFIGINETDNEIYTTDHGKQKIFSLNLDSALTNPTYIPETKIIMNERQFPNKYQYINDTLLIGVMIEPTGNSGYNHLVAKINTNTGKIIPLAYKHPEINRKRVCFALSTEHDTFIECYHYHDLITFYDLNGNFKYNIYGGKWNNKTTNEFGYYHDVVFTQENIIISYSNGKSRYSNPENGYPTQFLIFDIKGNYIKTLETELSILNFCYDKSYNRIIMVLDDNMQFAYLELDELNK